MGRVRYLHGAEESSLRAALSQREGTLREASIHFNEWRIARGKPALPPRREPYADHLQPIVLLALNTGLRRSELFHLQWEDIDFEAKWLTVRGVSAKNGQTRRIPLNAEALATLETWRKLAKDEEPRVFPGVGGGRLKRVDRAWRRLKKGRGAAKFPVPRSAPSLRQPFGAVGCTAQHRSRASRACGHDDGPPLCASVARSFGRSRRESGATT